MTTNKARAALSNNGETLREQGHSTVFICDNIDIELYIWVIDQVLGHDHWILAEFFFCMFMDQDGVELHKLTPSKKNEANIKPS